MVRSIDEVRSPVGSRGGPSLRCAGRGLTLVERGPGPGAAVGEGRVGGQETSSCECGHSIYRRPLSGPTDLWSERFRKEHDELENDGSICGECGKCEEQCPYDLPIMQRIKGLEEALG